MGPFGPSRPYGPPLGKSRPYGPPFGKSRPCGPPFEKVGPTGFHLDSPFEHTMHSSVVKNVIVHFLFVFGRSGVILYHFVKKKLTEIIFLGECIKFFFFIFFGLQKKKKKKKKKS